MLLHDARTDALKLALQEIGLTEQEQNLYLLSLEHGPTGAAELADELNISRPNIYKLFASLIARGLAPASSKKVRGEKFSVLSPSVIVDLVEKKRRESETIVEQFQNALPGLQAMYQQGGLPTRVKLIQGKEEFLNVFYQVVEESNEPIRYFGSASDLIQFVSWDEERKWIAKRLKKNVSIQCLITPSKDTETLNKNDAKELRETRIYEGGESLVGSYHVFANKVVFWQPKTPVVLLIEDEYIVSLLRNTFDFMWEASKQNTPS